MEHQLARSGGCIDPRLQADQIALSAFEVLDGFQQFLERSSVDQVECQRVCLLTGRSREVQTCLTVQRYRIRRRIFGILLKRRIYHRFRAFIFRG